MSEQRIDDLEARLRRIEDIDEIKRLRMRYHVNINSDRFDCMGELFTEDAVVDFGAIGQAHGLEDVKDLFMQIPKQTDYVKQYIHNHLVDVHGDEATGISFLDARYAFGGEARMVGAAFHETYRRCADGWRIAHLRVEVWFAAPIEQAWSGMTRETEVGSGGIAPFR